MVVSSTVVDLTATEKVLFGEAAGGAIDRHHDDLGVSHILNASFDSLRQMGIEHAKTCLAQCLWHSKSAASRHFHIPGGTKPTHGKIIRNAGLEKQQNYKSIGENNETRNNHP